MKFKIYEIRISWIVLGIWKRVLINMIKAVISNCLFIRLVYTNLICNCGWIVNAFIVFSYHYVERDIMIVKLIWIDVFLTMIYLFILINIIYLLIVMSL